MGLVSVLGILKNPMILLGLVSMGIFIGMPYLMDNSMFETPGSWRSGRKSLTLEYVMLMMETVDPEMKAEFEERQKSSTMNSLLSGQAAGQSPMGNFDMAAYLAGSSKKESPGNGGGKKDAGAVKR
jgi:ER membrane protein complex subunit 7